LIITPRSPNHFSGCQAGDVESAYQVDLHQLLKDIQRMGTSLAGRANSGAADCGAVHQYPGRAMRRSRLPYCVQNTFFTGDIGLDKQHSGLCGYLVAEGGVAIKNTDLCALKLSWCGSFLQFQNRYRFDMHVQFIPIEISGFKFALTQQFSLVIIMRRRGVVTLAMNMQ